MQVQQSKSRLGKGQSQELAVTYQVKKSPNTWQKLE
jgi:hypothetical protein